MGLSRQVSRFLRRTGIDGDPKRLLREPTRTEKTRTEVTGLGNSCYHSRSRSFGRD